jgi:hypothetical protein
MPHLVALHPGPACKGIAAPVLWLATRPLGVEAGLIKANATHGGDLLQQRLRVCDGSALKHHVVHGKPSAPVDDSHILPEHAIRALPRRRHGLCDDAHHALPAPVRLLASTSRCQADGLNRR